MDDNQSNISGQVQPPDTTSTVNYSDENAKLLFDIAKSEYDNERTRTSVIDTKTNTALALAGVVFTAIITAVDFSKIVNNISSITLGDILFLLLLGCLICFMISITNLISVIFTKTYKTLDVEYYSKSENLRRPQNMYTMVIATFYRDATSHNHQVNSKRVIKYDFGLRFLIISIFLFACYSILSGFTVWKEIIPLAEDEFERRSQASLNVSTPHQQPLSSNQQGLKNVTESFDGLQNSNFTHKDKESEKK